MRRILLSFLALIVLVLGVLPFALGKIVKYELMHAPAKLAQNPALAIRICDYREGWFRSRMTLEVQRAIPGLNAPLAEQVKLTIYHGPLLWTHPQNHRQWWGQASFVGKADWLPTQQPELTGLLVPIQLSGLITFWGNTLYVQTLANHMNYQAPNQPLKMSVEAIFGDFAWTLAGNHLLAQIILNNVNLADAQNHLQVNFPSLVIDSDRYNQNNLWLGSTTFLIPSTLASQNDHALLGVSELKLRIINQLTDQQKLNAHFGLNIGAVNLEDTPLISNLNFNLGIQNFDLEAVQNLKASLREAKPFSEVQAQALTVLQGMQIQPLKFSALTPYGRVQAKGFVHFAESMQTSTASFVMTLPKTALKTAMDATLPLLENSLARSLALPKGASLPAMPQYSLMQRFMMMTGTAVMDMYQANLFVEKSKLLVSRWQYQNGQIYLNGHLWTPPAKKAPSHAA